ncbi:hypothetical protein V473_02630 [Sphingobium cupriresistens LL01]|uniref:Uncharacterized protein n=1 Tax=Sphingobium cupriresistens LL01 TaxID=1420583 RepID=A0A0J8AWZ6_9SPHN|nr:hypothetical protein V473_02630 [Sphingobium cupriresistens LL01]
MAVERSYAESVIDLDRKISRAIQCGRGITLNPDQLDIMADIGFVSRLAEEKARILQEQAQWRRKKAASINEASSGSIMSGAPTDAPPATDFTSGGTTPQTDGSNARARARQMFDTPATR